MGGLTASDTLMGKETTGNCIWICCRQSPFLYFHFLGIWQRALSENPNSPTPWTDIEKTDSVGLALFSSHSWLSPSSLFKYNNGLATFKSIFHQNLPWGPESTRMNTTISRFSPFYWLKRKDSVEVRAKEHSRARNQAAITNRCVLCTKYKACRLHNHLPFILSDPNV